MWSVRRTPVLYENPITITVLILSGSFIVFFLLYKSRKNLEFSEMNLTLLFRGIGFSAMVFCILSAELPIATTYSSTVLQSSMQYEFLEHGKTSFPCVKLVTFPPVLLRACPSNLREYAPCA